jgi:glycogen synthase
MHFLFLASEFPPMPGGIATYLGHATRMFSRAGHRVTVLTVGDTPGTQALEENIQIIRLAPHLVRSAPKIYRKLSHWPSLSFQFAEALIDYLNTSGERPDIIEAQDNGALAYYLLQRRLVEATPLSGIPILLYLHWPEIENTRCNRVGQYRFPAYWVGRMERFCFNAADALLSPSQFLREQIISQGYTNQPIDVIPLPACDPDGKPNAASGTPQPGDIVCVGRLEYRKGIMQLVAACADLWAKGFNFRLTIIGSEKPPYEYYGRPLSAIVEEKYGSHLRSGQLIMQGPLPQAQLFQRLNTAWAVVIPSLSDNYPYTSCEAMLAGKVVLASTSGGQSEMIGTNGQNGYIFDWANAETFERAMQAALDLSVAENLTLGRNAQQRITALTSYETILPQRLDHYYQTIKQAEARRDRRLFPAVNWELAPALATNTEDGAGIPGLLSVVIPFYNLGLFLKETLDSVLASTYRPLEILIVDDGSTEAASLSVLDSISELHNNHVRVIHTPNQGLASTRNTGAREAHGEFLAFVDSDDLVHPDFFSRAVRVLQSYDNVGFVYSWAQYFGNSTDWWPTWNTEFPYLLGHNMLVPLVTIRRSAFLQHGCNRTELEFGLEDWDAWIRLTAAGYLGVSLPHLLVKYRVRKNSMFRSISTGQFLYLQGVINRGSQEVYRQYAIELLNLVNTNGPSQAWWYPTMQTDLYGKLKGRFFSLASRPGFIWLYRLIKPLRNLYSWLRR